MELSNEDNLRLNVLLNQNTQAIRIDESTMTVHALTERGEAKVKLNPNFRDERYLSSVRELVSTHVLGSPGGYPVYLKRWTRMGQARAQSLEQLLLLGEPEAVVAVVHASGLSEELARRAWWCMPTSDNARRMLEKPSVADGAMGPVLAAFLNEFMPFESESRDIIESVELVLQPGLIDAQSRAGLWQKARRKNAYFVGFLLACPMQLPEPPADNPRLQTHREVLQGANGNAYAQLLYCLWQGGGQQFLHTVRAVLHKPNDQDVMVKLLQAVDRYFRPYRPDWSRLDDIEAVTGQSTHYLQNHPPLRDLIQKQAGLQADLQALLLLCGATETLVNPIFSRSNAIGSVMRRKLEPVTTPLWQACNRLLETP